MMSGISRQFFLLAVLLLASSLPACVFDIERKLHICAASEVPPQEIRMETVRYCEPGLNVLKTEQGRPFCGKFSDVARLQQQQADAEADLREVEALIRLREFLLTIKSIGRQPLRLTAGFLP